MLTVPGMEPRLEIAIAELGHLFNVPAIDPLSASLPERLGLSGVDGLLEELQLRPRLEAVAELVVCLPTGTANPALVAHMQAALKAHLAMRIERQTQAIRATALYGWRVFAVALGLLALCLAISSIFASESLGVLPPWLQRTLESGFEIVGWVMMWHPVDVLLFEPVRLRRKLRALRLLAGARVVVDERGV
jgi:hypothetical protein